MKQFKVIGQIPQVFVHCLHADQYCFHGDCIIIRSKQGLCEKGKQFRLARSISGFEVHAETCDQCRLSQRWRFIPGAIIDKPIEEKLLSRKITDGTITEVTS